MLAGRVQSRLLGAAVLRRWWLMPAAVALAMAVAAAFTAAQTPLYEAAASLVVVPSSEVREPGDMLRSLETLERRTIVATLAKVPVAPGTRSGAAERLGVPTGELGAYRAAAAVQPYTNVIAITVTGPDAERAAAFANALLAASRREARSLYPTFRLETLAEAAPARRPASPAAGRNLLVAAVLGLVIGALGAWLAGRTAQP